MKDLFSLVFFRKSKTRKADTGRDRLRLTIEQLERRWLYATFSVNTFNDSVAIDLSSGADASGLISLRSAIMAANSQVGSHTIRLPNGTHGLSIQGINEASARSGDLDVRSRISIEPTVLPTSSLERVVIDANAIDRVFEVFAGASLSLKNLEVMNGVSLQGGGILNRGRILLDNVILTSEAIGAEGTVGISNGSFGTNGGAASGGAIFNATGGSVEIKNSTVTGYATGGRGGNASLLHHSVTPFSGGNGGSGGLAFGGAIYNVGGSLSISNSSITGFAIGGDGGNAGNGGVSDLVEREETVGLLGVARSTTAHYNLQFSSRLTCWATQMRVAME